MTGPFAASLLILALFDLTNPSDAAALGLLMICVGAIVVPWYVAKRILVAGWWRTLAIWISAWIPLTLVNTALGMTTRFMFAESFIVPTGAMAPTIIGAHADRVCSNCGCEFNVSLSHRLPTDGFNRLNFETISTRCPNCRKEDVVTAKAPLLRGDRVLTDKTIGPTRWSVVVLRNPRNRAENFVKRLVALPGESVELSGGEIFINGALSRKEPHLATDLWLPLHDTSFVPNEVDDDTPRWQPRNDNSGWHESHGSWKIEGGVQADDVLEFHGEVTDFMAYNDHSFNQEEVEHVVGDVLVTCEIGEWKGPGALNFQWELDRSRVEAAVQHDGAVTIQTRTEGESGDVDRSHATGMMKAPIEKGGSLVFAIRDGQAYVLYNGDAVALTNFGSDDVASWRERAGPDSPCRLALAARDCSLTLDRITIHRDIYYVGGEISLQATHATAGNPFELAEDECFVLGDNSPRSQDSRFFGAVPSTDILGVVRWIYWPKIRWHELQ